MIYPVNAPIVDLCARNTLFSQIQKQLSFELGIRILQQIVFLVPKLKMSFNGLEYALEGSSNYVAWKYRMEAVLEDNGLKEFVDMDVQKPTDPAEVEAWQKKMAKCRRILLEGVKDHIVSSLHGKPSPYLMWKPLT